MEEKNISLHEVVITAIIVKDGKYLVTKRSMKEKRFPGFWTVPFCLGEFGRGEKLQSD